jgi:hypothetical protein
MAKQSTGSKKPQGLGDTIEKATKATGVKKVVQKVFKDCGCEERKEKLNKLFPYYNKEKSCMNEEQIKYYEGFKEKFLTGNHNTIPHEDMQKFIDLYNTIFQTNIKGCQGCNAKMYYERIEKVYQKLKG